MDKIKRVKKDSISVRKEKRDNNFRQKKRDKREKNSHARWLVVEHTSELTKGNKVRGGVRGRWATRILVAVLRFIQWGKKRD